MARERLSWRITVGVGILLALFFGALLFAGFDYVWTEYRWFASIGKQGVLVTRVLSQLGVWLACTTIAAAVLYSTARYCGQITERGERFNRFALVGSVLVGALASINMANNWMTFRLAIAQSPFGVVEPQFGKDVGVFVFTLPALELLSSWFNGLIVLSLMLVFAIVAIPRREGSAERISGIGWQIKPIVSVLAGMLMLSVAFNFWIQIWRLDYTSRAQLVGASYADVHAQLPANWIMVVLSLALAVLLFATARSKNWKLPAYAVGAWAVAGIALVSAWPALVQNYVVTPNEETLEAPYIQRNIDMTRAAFDLEDIDTQAYSASETMTPEASSRATAAMSNTRVWEPGSVKQAYSQLETIRPYYRLSKIQTDRYRVDDALTQVLVAAREIDTTGLPKKAQTWVNQHLVYTHGYGLAIASASDTTLRGFPRFLVSDVPPTVASEIATGSPDLVAEQPRIYYGSRTSDYAIVNTKIDEFDYPKGDTNATYRHEAADGVRFGSFLERIMWAVRLRSDQVLFSDYLTPDSQVLLYRQIRTRARKIAPWLEYDKNPYPAIVDGRVVWILDGYTSSDHYPYSQPLDDGTNYLRDSVKVTVDAYTGETRFYANGDDPIRDAWAKIFPGVITPQSEIPPELAAHFRYPERLFSAQSDVYRTYHMTDPTVFYNKEDQWQVASDKEGDPVKPAYLLLDLPASAPGTGMYLMQPYAAPKRDNMLGIMAAASEPAEYGERTVYTLPKERVVLGPQQVIARIEQDPTISPQLSLWDQRGSKVTFGDMVVAPVEGSIVYVQPVFLQAENAAITELAAVIVVSGDKVVMRPTLSGALAAAFGNPEGSEPAAASGAASGAQIDALLDEALQARAAKDWATYNAKLEELRATLDAASTSASQTGAQ